MTKDEFIEMYLRNSGLPLDVRTENGFRLPEDEEEALALPCPDAITDGEPTSPCSCGEPGCEGWVMHIPKLERIMRQYE